MPDVQATPELERFLGQVPLFARVPPGAPLADLARLLTADTLVAGQVLFREGERGTSLWLLGEGVEVAVAALNGVSGRPQALSYVRQGDTVGEMSLVDGRERSGTARVVQGGRALRLDILGFGELRRAHAPAAYQVLRSLAEQLCAKLRRTSDRIVPQSPSLPPPSPPAPGRRPDPQSLDHVPAMRDLPAVVKLALCQKLELLDYPGVQPIFSEGELADAAYFVLSGDITVGRNGRTLTQLGPGKMFGLVAAIDGGQRSASCVTAGPAKLLRLKNRDFDALFSSGHRFAFQLVDWVCRQLVEHLREANRLLPVAGQAVTTEEDFLPEAEVLPLELELELDAGTAAPEPR